MNHQVGLMTGPEVDVQLFATEEGLRCVWSSKVHPLKESQKVTMIKWDDLEEFLKHRPSAHHSV